MCMVRSHPFNVATIHDGEPFFMSFTHFSDLTPQHPDMDAVQADYDKYADAITNAQEPAAALEAIGQWDETRKRLGSWSSLVRLRYRQDTTNKTYKADNDLCDEVWPKMVALDNRIKQAVLDSPHRGAIADHFGEHVQDLWTCDVAAFDPSIQDDMVKTSKLNNEYTSLRAKARIEFQGETHTLAGLGKFSLDDDRQVRYEATKTTWDWFEENGDALDEIFDGLVKTRHKMAKALSNKDFVELGYRWMQRIDYGRKDVERFRKEVQTHLVPLTVELRRQQAQRLGLDEVMYWDEGIFDLGGAPKLGGDTPWLVKQARDVFKKLGPETDHFFSTMDDCGLLDLDAREGKASGGFCTAFPDKEVPFIFANFNGTHGDVRTFIHELGHAFQYWSSRKASISDYLWPTYESCEIHSMSLEFLTWPHMESFFGDDAERFRQTHLTFALLFIPYGVAVDHFQHMVYENPDASPADRHAMWKEIEELYTPARKYGDIKRLNEGALWQRQLHIYGAPFYYIDYTLAQTCALQFWSRSLTDPAGAMKDYTTLCKRGGDAPFQALARSAGLISPFDQGCLADVVDHAAKILQSA
mgnify:CR=1 FL=1